ncbi:MAG: hypothetical protein IKK60_04745 [Clostridia bacterium]|nr:hypothetical protein [Clostridia bacterium]
MNKKTQKRAAVREPATGLMLSKTKKPERVKIALIISKAKVDHNVFVTNLISTAITSLSFCGHGTPCPYESFLLYYRFYR